MRRGNELKQHRIEIQSKPPREPGGGRAEKWPFFAYDDCTIIPVSVSSPSNMAQMDSATTHRLLFDHRPVLDASKRVNYQGRIMEYRGGPFNMYEAGRVWEVHVEELGIKTRNPGGENG